VIRIRVKKTGGKNEAKGVSMKFHLGNVGGCEKGDVMKRGGHALARDR